MANRKTRVISESARNSVGGVKEGMWRTKCVNPCRQSRNIRCRACDQQENDGAGNQYSPERENIAECQRRAAGLRRNPLLEIGAERNDEESSGDSGKQQVKQRPEMENESESFDDGNGGAGEVTGKRQEQRNAEPAERNEPQLDFIAGEQPGEITADPHAEGGREKQRTQFHRGGVQCELCKDDDQSLNRDSDGYEKGVAECGNENPAVFRDGFPACPDAFQYTLLLPAFLRGNGQNQK